MGVPLNWTTARGRHNSYHVQPSPALPEWLYSHPPIAEQLSEGMRHFEFDIVAPAVELGNGTDFRVMHVEGFDQGSVCESLYSCVRELSQWSQLHSTHFPLYVWLETKDFLLNAANAAIAENAVKSAWHNNSLIFSPGDLRGSERSLRSALNVHGWPNLEDMRGRVIFVLDQPDTQYSQLTLDKLFFICYSYPPPVDAAFIKENDPSADITRAIEDGYIVRSRSDASFLPNYRQLTDHDLLQMYFDVINTDTSDDITRTEFHSFVLAVTGYSIPDDLLDQLWYLCAGQMNGVVDLAALSCVDQRVEAVPLPVNLAYFVPTQSQLVTQSQTEQRRNLILNTYQSQIVATDFPFPVAPFYYFTPLPATGSFGCRPQLQDTAQCQQFPSEFASGQYGVAVQSNSWQSLVTVSLSLVVSAAIRSY